MERVRGRFKAIRAGGGDARRRRAGETAPSRQGLAALGRNRWDSAGPGWCPARVSEGKWAYLWIRLIVAAGAEVSRDRIGPERFGGGDLCLGSAS